MSDDDAESRKAGETDGIDAINRRDFLKIVGASFAALTAAGCKVRLPKEKIVPLLEGPEGFVPGKARWYASTCSGCSASCGTLVKSRDGRPIKLEGNPDHPLSRGGLCARGQATILDLYDSERLRRPETGGSAASWQSLDAAVGSGLERAAASGRAVRLLSRTTTSPSLLEAAARFAARHPGARHVVYDSLSSSAILEAHRRTHGRAVLPRYFFGRARVIVSFDADFLGTWVSPVEFTKDWSSNRRPEGEWELMSWHAQFEPRMSVTGANADLRVPLKPSDELAAVVELGRRVAERLGASGPRPPSAGTPGLDPSVLDRTADMLAGARGRSLVVSGSADPAVQTVVNWLNQLLGSYGQTLDIARPGLQKRGEDAALEGLIEEMERGKVEVLILWDANPAYDHPRADAFARALAKVPLTVALAERKDETASLTRWAAPAPHPLESWGDAEPAAGVASLFQPALAPLFDSRPVLESLLRWSGSPLSAHDFIRDHWRRAFFPRQKEARAFEAFWTGALKKGFVALAVPEPAAPAFDARSIERAVPARRPAPDGAFELAAYAGVALADGRQANNPWLQELPDPVTRASWGNYASFSPADAERLGLVEGRVVRLTAGGRAVELPAHVQPGQARGVVAAALGYGRTAAGAVAANFPMVKLLPVERDLLAGANLYPFLRSDAVRVEALPRMSPLAKVQTYDSLTDPILGQKRPFIRETTLQDYYRDPRAGNPPEPEEESLWPRHTYEGHKWGMAIDLNACTGCSACVVGCQAENNVPVVGKAEMRKSRDMAWLRIDRYFAPASEAGADSPRVSFQPMLCQHCDNAPCETVCPVLATSHSSEGLNMQVYNRCVGTRYCANNCPYKVRRFNWFDYAHQDAVQNLSLNPDVTVRTRGVMEKCSFCVQRIYTAKADAGLEGRELRDGDVKSACQQSCPADAIVFGDLNDPDSRVSKLARSARGYRVLSELGVGPSVFYQTKVRNEKV